MSLPGETISDGAAPRCDECGRMPKLDVYLSGVGYYIGTDGRRPLLTGTFRSVVSQGPSSARGGREGSTTATECPFRPLWGPAALERPHSRPSWSAARRRPGARRGAAPRRWSAEYQRTGQPRPRVDFCGVGLGRVARCDETAVELAVG